MKPLAKVAFGSLTCVLLISAIGVINPRAVHAVVATIIRDQDNPARHPFVTSCFFLDAGICQTPAIPTGQEFVIETISVSGSGSPGNSVAIIGITTDTGGVGTTITLNPVFDSGIEQPILFDFSTAQPLRLYADPGTVVQCFVTTKQGFPSAECLFSGYLVSLP
jgi:hypothetical protein